MLDVWVAYIEDKPFLRDLTLALYSSAEPLAGKSELGDSVLRVLIGLVLVPVGIISIIFDIPALITILTTVVEGIFHLVVGLSVLAFIVFLLITYPLPAIAIILFLMLVAGA